MQLSKEALDIVRSRLSRLDIVILVKLSEQPDCANFHQTKKHFDKIQKTQSRCSYPGETLRTAQLCKLTPNKEAC